MEVCRDDSVTISQPFTFEASHPVPGKKKRHNHLYECQIVATYENGNECDRELSSTAACVQNRLQGRKLEDVFRENKAVSFETVTATNVARYISMLVLDLLSLAKPDVLTIIVMEPSGSSVQYVVRPRRSSRLL